MIPFFDRWALYKAVVVDFVKGETAYNKEYPEIDLCSLFLWRS